MSCSKPVAILVVFYTVSVADSPWSRLKRKLTYWFTYSLALPWVEEQQTGNWPNCIDHHESAH